MGWLLWEYRGYWWIPMIVGFACFGFLYVQLLTSRLPPQKRDSGMVDLIAEIRREADLREKGWVSFVNPPLGSPSPIGRMIDIIDRKGEITTWEYDRIPVWWNVSGKFWRASHKS